MRGYIETGVQEGARLVIDGRSQKVAGFEDGYFLGADLFDGVRPDMRIYQGGDLRTGAEPRARPGLRERRAPDQCP